MTLEGAFYLITAKVGCELCLPFFRIAANASFDVLLRKENNSKLYQFQHIPSRTKQMVVETWCD